MIFAESQREALREATYQTDREARRMAEFTWASLVHYVRQNEDDLDPMHLGAMRGYYVQGPKAGLPGWLTVAFMPPKRGTGASYSKQDRDGLRHLIVLHGTSLDPDWPTVADELDMSRVRANFIHEFTHYLDQMRFKGKKAAFAAKSKAARRHKDQSAYYHNAAEFNAHYQAAAHTVETGVMADVKKAALGRTMKKVVRKDMDAIFANFNTFHAHITQGYKPMAQAVRAMEKTLKGSKWERKFDKRLHGLYVGLKQKVRKALAEDMQTLFTAAARQALKEASVPKGCYYDWRMAHGKGS